jgi:anaerobic selenocysteine-containing dehydrogenase
MPEIKTHCKICNCRCGVIVTVEDGKAVGVAGDPDCQKNEGALCVKGRAMLELIYDPDRLRQPLKKAGDHWEEISWDQALEEIATKLIRLKQEEGPEKLAVYRGLSVFSWLVTVYLKRFINIYGTPNMATNAALCVSSKGISNRYSFGLGVSACGDFLNSKCILLFGANPAVSGMHRSLRVMKDILRAKKNGATLIVVDPRKTETAAKADIYTTIRPGTDLALILAIINLIIENGWYDREFVAKYTTGFEQLAEACRSYTPAEVERITWVNREIIREIAYAFSHAESACADRREGLIQYEYGTQACRALHILNAITGNVDVPGGLILQTNLFAPAGKLAAKLCLNEQFKPAAKPVAQESPITHDIPSNLMDAILDGTPYPIKALLCLGGNPLLAWPNSTAVEAMLKKLDLLVVVDLYLSETATFADYVLPAASFLEKIDLQAPDVALPKIVQLQQQAIAPLHGAKSEFQIIKELAVKMGYGEYFQESEIELLDEILKNWGLSVQHLTQNPSGIEVEPRPVGYYHQHPFATPSGMIELYSADLEKLGLDPVPQYHEVAESPVSQPELAQRFPLILVTGNRINAAYLSFTHNMPSLHAKQPENQVELHSETARERGIADGDPVIVSSPRGEIRLPAKLNPKVDPRVLVVPYGWGHRFGAAWQLANSSPGANVNILTNHKVIDKMSGMPDYKTALCQVAKAR